MLSKQRTAACAILCVAVVALVGVFAVGILPSEAEDGGGGGSELPNERSYDLSQLTGIEVDHSGIPDSIYTSLTLDALKGYLVVTGTFEGVDPPEQVLDSADYTLSTFSGSLEQGTNVVTVSVPRTHYVEEFSITGVLLDHLLRIEVESPSMTIYDNTPDSDIISNLTIMGIFESDPDNPIELDKDSCSITWSHSAGDNVTFTVQIMYDGTYYTAAFGHEVLSVDVDSISDAHTTTKVYSHMSLDDLKRFTEFTGINNNGTTEIDKNDIVLRVIGGVSLSVGEDELGTDYLTKQIGVYRASDNELLYSMNVNVYPSRLTSISVQLSDTEYMAFESVDRSDLVVIANFEDEYGNTYNRTLEPSEYDIIYLDSSGAPTDRDHFLMGDNRVRIEYKENGISSSSSPYVTVDYALVDVPYRSSGTDGNYTGGTFSWTVSNYDSELLRWSETGTNLGLSVTDNEDGTLTITATNVGNYELTFEITDSNYEWSNGGRDPVEISFTIMVHASNITVTYPQGLTYTGVPCRPDVVVIGIGDQTIQNPKVTYVYYGVTANGESRGSESNPIAGIPVEAGVWQVRASFEGNSNFAGSNTGFQSLTIGRATLTTPTVNPKEYILNTTQTSKLTGGDNWQVVSGTDFGGKTVGTYHVTVEVTDTNNYMWSNGESTIEVSWNIIPRSIERPTANSITYTYNGLEHEYVPIYAEGTQQYLDISGHLQTDAGNDYAAVISLHDRVNCKWADGQANDTTISWSIQRLGIPVPIVNSGTYEYTGNAVTAGLTNYYSDRMTYDLSDDLSFSDGMLSAVNAGTYTIGFTPTSNYQWNDGLENPTGQRSVPWTIAVADNTISGLSIEGWTYGDGPNSPSITGATFDSSRVVYYYTPSGASEPGNNQNAPTNAGNYLVWAVIPVDPNGNYNESDVVSYPFTIERQGIGVPDIEYPNSKVPKYTGILITVNSGTHDTYTILDNSNQATNAGTHHMIVVPTSNYQWNDGLENPTGQRSVPWTIAVADNTISGLSIEGWTYGDGPNSPSITGATFDSSRVVYYYTPSGASEPGNNQNAPTNAGNYLVWAVIPVDPNGNYNESDVVSHQFTISKRPITPDLIWSDENQSRISEHTGSAQHPEVSISDTVLTDTGYAISWDDVNSTQVGVYHVTLTFNEGFGDNFEWAASTDQGDIYYSGEEIVDQDQESGDTITLWYRITQTQYEIVLSIGSGMQYTGSFPSWNDDPASVISNYDSLPDEVKDALKDSDNWRFRFFNEESVDAPNVGTYTVTLYIDTTANYELNITDTNRAIFTITPLILDYEAPSNGSETYDGDYHQSLATGIITHPSGGMTSVVEYSTDGGRSWSEDIPSFKDVANIDEEGNVIPYTIHYRITTPNHTTVKDITYTFTINPMPISITISDQHHTYTGSIPTIPIMSEDGNLLYTITSGNVVNGDDLDLSFTTTGSDVAGSPYAITGDWDNTNYIVTFYSGRCYIDNATITVTNVSPYNGTYDAESHQLGTVTAVTVNNQPLTVEYSLDSTSYSQTLERTNADEYTVYYRITAPNHETVNGKFNATIGQAELTASFIGRGITYGESFNPGISDISFKGFVGRETISVLNTDGLYFTHTYVSDAIDRTQAGSTIEVTPAGIVSSNYTIDYEPGILTVGKRQLSVTILSETLSYVDRWSSISQDVMIPDGQLIDSQASVFTVYVEDHDVSWVPDSQGTYTLTLSLTEFGQRNYDCSVTNGTYTIQRSGVTLDLDTPDDLVYNGQQKKYDATVIGYESTIDVIVSYEEFVGDQWVSFEGIPVGAGNYRAIFKLDNDNFAATNAIVPFVIQKARYDFTHSVNNYNGQYDGQSHIPELIVTLNPGHDDITPTIRYDESYMDVCTGQPVNFYLETTSTNYDVSGVFATGYVTITPRQVSVVWNNTDTFEYDGTSQNDDVRAYYVDVFNKQVELNEVTEENGGVFMDFRDSGYLFTASMITSDPNYQLTNTTANYVISKRPISIQILDAERQYGDLEPTFRWEYAPGSNVFLNGDGSTLKLITNATQDSSISTATNHYTIYFESENMLNYSLNVTDGVLTIEPREITVALIPQSVTYGVYDDTAEIVLDQNDWEMADGSTLYKGILPGIYLSVSDPSLNVGSYDICGSWSNTNYLVVFQDWDDAFTITPAEMSVSIGTGDVNLVPNQNLVYSGTGYPVIEENTSPTANTADMNYDTNVTFVYSLIEEGEYSSDIPTVTTAGPHTVYFQASKTNHEVYSGSFVVNVAKADNEWITRYDNGGWTYGSYVYDVTDPVAVFGTETVSIAYEYWSADSGWVAYTGGFNGETSAGSYRAMITILGTTNYAGLNDTVEFTVQRASYSPSWSITDPDDLVFTGDPITNTLTLIEGRAEFTSWTTDGTAVSFAEAGGNIILSMSASSVATYSATITITDRNYVFNNGSDQITLNWSVFLTENQWTTPVSIQGWTYGEQPNEPQGEVLMGSVVFTYSDKSDGVFSLVMPIDAGTWYLRATVEATGGYSVPEPVTIPFVISPASVPIPSVNEVTTYKYLNGDPIYLDVYYDSTHVIATGHVAINAGDQSAEFRLNDTRNYKWAVPEGSEQSETDPVTIPWYVNPATVTVPSNMDPDEKNSYQYNTDLWTFLPNGFDFDTMRITGNVQRDKGDYTAIVSLQNTMNYQWSTGGTELISIPWHITAMPKDAPSLVLPEDMIYSGDEIIIGLEDFDRVVMRILSSNAAIHSDTNLTLGSVNSGEYWARVSLASSNYEWDDDVEVEDDGTVLLQWTVEKRQLLAPSGGEFPMYNNGEEVTYIPNGYNPSIMSISDNVKREVGSYQAVVRIIDSNYRWADGVDPDGDGRVYVPWRVLSSEFDADDLEYVLDFIYDGEEHVPIVNGCPSWLSYQIDGVPVEDVGSGEFTISFSSSDDRYAAPSNQTVTVNVHEREIELIADVSDKIYGDNLDLNWAYGSDLEFLDDVDLNQIRIVLYDEDGDMVTSEFPGVGTYTVRVVLPVGISGNYEVHCTDRMIEISQRSIIVQIELESSIYGQTIASLNAHIIEGELVPGDSEPWTLSTDATSSSEPGTYNIIGTCTNSNYDIEFRGQGNAYTILRISLEPPIVFNDRINYDGGYDVSIELDGFDPVTMRISGNIATDVGNYTAYVSIIDTAHYMWEDGSTEPVEYHWSVVDDDGLYVGLEDDEEPYTGDEIYVAIEGFDMSVMGIVDEMSADISYRNGGFYLCAKDVGTYHVYVSISEGHSWSVDVTVDGNGYAVLTFVVTKIVVTVPEPNSEPSYTGETIYAPFDESDLYRISGEVSGIDSGWYTAEFTLNNPNTHMWDGHSPDVATVSVDWYISPAGDVSEEHFDVDDKTFTSTDIPSPVTNDLGLIEDRDYTVSYSDDTYNVGQVTVTVTGMGNYSFSFELEYDISEMGVSLPATPGPFEYNGEVQTAFESTHEWYTVSGVRSEVDVGDYTATLHLRYNTDGHTNVVWVDDGTAEDRDIIWSILSVELPGREDGGWNFDTEDEEYTGSGITKEVTNDTIDESEFTVSYENNINVGTAIATVTGNGNYTGSWSFEFQIIPKGIPEPAFPTSFPYTGETITLEIPESDDYEVTGGTISESEVGYYEVVISLTDTNNTMWVGGSVDPLTIGWRISGASIGTEDDWIFDDSSVVYDGTAHEREPTHPTLIEDVDYEVSHTDNVNAGTVVVTVTGIGNYGGTLEFSFEIIPATPTVVEWPNATSITRGDSLSESTLRGGSATGVDGLDLEGIFVWIEPDIVPSVGTASFGVMFVPSGDNYASVQGEVGVTVNTPSDPDPPVNPDPPVDPDDPDEPVDPVPEPVTDIEFPEAGDITEGQTLADSVLTGGSEGGEFAWADPGFAPPVGDHSYLMVFTPTDGRDYSQVEGWDAETGTVQRMVDITVDPVVIPEPEPEDDGWSFPWWVLLVVIGMIVVGIAYRRDDEEEQ